MANKSSERNPSRVEKFKQEIPSFIAGAISGMVIAIVIAQLIVNQDLLKDSTVAVELTDWQHGQGCLLWDFTLQPERKFLFSRTKEMGCFLHLEVSADSSGVVPNLELKKYELLKFYARSSNEFLQISEINAFVGPHRVQYMYTQIPVIINTGWKEYTIKLDAFKRAPWVEDQYPLSINSSLDQITAFGFDIKTKANLVFGKVWIDDLRLQKADGSEDPITDCENLAFQFQSKTIRWRSDWRIYGR